MKAIRNFQCYLPGNVSCKIHNYKNNKFELVIVFPKHVVNSSECYCEHNKFLSIDFSQKTLIKKTVSIRRMIYLDENNSDMKLPILIKVEDDDFFEGTIVVYPKFYALPSKHLN